MNKEKEIAKLARELLEATKAIHEIHSTTAVHENGYGFAGRAITPHCAWKCNVVGAHVGEVVRYEVAVHELERALES